MKREVVFDSSAIYSTNNPDNQGDINKLFGFADCNSHHHTNSARFGWRWFNGQLEIHAYNYVKKVRQYQLLEVIQLNRPYAMSISATNDKYTFRIDDRQYNMPRGCSAAVTFKYLLYPYFGGDEKAPHDIVIELNKI
ncbi:MAG: hypothetical protein H0V66_01290 [Bdellovibrionales bacterium]|nr:hypothetical protein [Bdellovibrionales bacterium]